MTGSFLIALRADVAPHLARIARVGLFTLALVLAAGCSASEGQGSDDGDGAGSSGSGSSLGSTDKKNEDGDVSTDAGSVNGDPGTVLGIGEIGPSVGDNNGLRLDQLYCEYETIEEDDTTFTGRITVGNANQEYVYNGYFFDIWSIDFTTTSTITEAKTDDFIAIDYSQDADVLKLDMGWQSVFPLGKLITFNIKGKKAGRYPYPSRCSPRYIRGDILYPVYDDLPRSWWKGKENIDADDLIVNQDEYYREDIGPIKEGIFIYEPLSQTQLLVGEPEVVSGAVVNNADNVRIWIPSKMLAMSLAVNYQWFKYNPNYFCALGTKENFACGLIPKVDSSVSEHYVELDGKTYHWYIQFGSPDGPFQQETGNFSDMTRFLPDYFPDDARHDDYTSVKSQDDDKWITAVISSAISNVVNRETYWAAPDNKGNYGRLVRQGADPFGELAMMTFTYNRGVYSICEKNIFVDMPKALASKDLINDFGLIGFADHVPTVKAITQAMNEAVDRRYDAQLTFADIERFMGVFRTFYPHGVPTDEEWDAMLLDQKRAFDVLAQHWGGDTVSYRYDFLTLLRVALHHLPKPTNPRPAGFEWLERVNQFYC